MVLPEISRFYGITIKMFFIDSEHNPPHFHAIYGEFVGEFDIRTLALIDGDLPVKAQSLVKEWAAEHKHELIEIWTSQSFRKISPLV
jgi:hypothetical protein